MNNESIYLYFIQCLSHSRAEYNWKHTMYQKYFCSECRLYKDDMHKEVMDICLRDNPGIAALNVIFNLGFYFARRDFLDIFGDEVDKCLKLGQVFDREGRQLEEYVTYTADIRILLRGQKQSKHYGICNQCGAQKYVAKYPWYIIESSLLGRSIYVSWVKSGLIVTEELVKQVDRKKFKGIDVFKIPILPEPVKSDEVDLPLTI